MSLALAGAKKTVFALYLIVSVSFAIESKVSVVKAVTAKTGSVFPPLKRLHTEAQISSEELEKQWKAKKGRWRASRCVHCHELITSAITLF